MDTTFAPRYPLSDGTRALTNRERIAFGMGASTPRVVLTNCGYRALTDVDEESTPALVREFATLKVWFAVNEVDGRHPHGNVVHARLRSVVNALRKRNVLD